MQLTNAFHLRPRTEHCSLFGIAMAFGTARGIKALCEKVILKLSDSKCIEPFIAFQCRTKCYINTPAGSPDIIL
jgi:hypothetical protein